jgi:type I restriction enzyme S subunit
MSCRSFPTHWQLLPLAEALDALIDYRGKTPKKTDTGIPLITAKIVKNGKILPVSEFIAEEDYDEWMVRGLPQVGDVVVTTEAPLGEVAQLEDCNVALAQRIVTLRGAKEILESDYLRYVMQGPYVQGQLEARASGSTVKGIKQSELRKILLPIPPKQEQTKIAKILKSIDNKIRINEQASQTLEQIAQAIFKSWFVDFEPVKAKIAALAAGGSEEDALFAAMQAISGKDKAQLTQLQTENPEHYNQLRTTAELFPSAMQDSELGEIPEGWEADKLSKLIDFNPRRTLKKGTPAPYLDMKNVPTSGHLAEEVVIREMKSGTKFINGDTLLARITPCLENGKTAYVDFLADKQVGWGSTEYIVMRSQESYPESLSYFIARDPHFREHAIRTMTGTSGRQRANAKALADLAWVIYPLSLVNAFNKLAQPYLNIAKRNGDESRSLSTIRDALLPRLLSGHLSLNINDSRIESEMLDG